MLTLLRRIEKSEIDEAEVQAFRHQVGCARRLAKSNQLIATFEERSLRILAEEGASSGIIHVSEKLHVSGNKARAGRVSCLAAPFGAILVPFGPQGE